MILPSKQLYIYVCGYGDCGESYAGDHGAFGDGGAGDAGAGADLLGPGEHHLLPGELPGGGARQGHQGGALHTTSHNLTTTPHHTTTPTQSI